LTTDHGVRRDKELGAGSLRASGVTGIVPGYIVLSTGAGISTIGPYLLVYDTGGCPGPEVQAARRATDTTLAATAHQRNPTTPVCGSNGSRCALVLLIGTSCLVRPCGHYLDRIHLVDVERATNKCTSLATVSTPRWWPSPGTCSSSGGARLSAENGRRRCCGWPPRSSGISADRACGTPVLPVDLHKQ